MCTAFIITQHFTYTDWRQYVPDRQWFASKMPPKKYLIAGLATAALMMYFLDVNPAQWVQAKQYNEKSITHTINQLEKIYQTVNYQHYTYIHNSYIREAAGFWIRPKPPENSITTAAQLTNAIVKLDRYNMKFFCSNGIKEEITWWEDRLTSKRARSRTFETHQQSAITQLTTLRNLLHCSAQE